eukprot:765881-Hanusia_phi.AAC.1
MSVLQLVIPPFSADKAVPPCPIRIRSDTKQVLSSAPSTPSHCVFSFSALLSASVLLPLASSTSVVDVALLVSCLHVHRYQEMCILLNQERYEMHNRKQIMKANPPQNRTRGR